MYATTLLKDFLEKNRVKYTTMKHSAVYSALELARAIHMPARAVAKTVVIEVDDKPALAVLPANYHIDFDRLLLMLKAKEVRKMSEREFACFFPGCEVGAMPPFGNLFKLPVLVDASFYADKDIVFAAGTYTDAIRMRYEDFEKLVKPLICHFSDAPVKTRAATQR